jgi:sugar/nucleoside kinase (ribokinase family)
LGAKGAFALDCITKKEFSCDSVKTDVVSTVGAGDSFSAAFLYQLFQKKDIQFSLKYASKIAGYVVSEFDAVPDYNLNDFVLS